TAAVSPLTPPYLAPADMDYGRAFQTLADVQGDVIREGLTTELLLRRCHARYALGNYLAAAFDAERVLQTDRACAEALYVKGLAMLALAAVKHGIARPGVGADVPVEALPSRKQLIESA